MEWVRKRSRWAAKSVLFQRQRSASVEAGVENRRLAMPYMTSGKTVYKVTGGRKKKVANAKSKASAKKMVRMLYMIKELPRRGMRKRRGR